MAVGLYFVLKTNFHRALFKVNEGSNYLIRLTKDVSFLNKPIIKNRLEKVPENSFVLIDTSRADFIDRDIIEVIEDFTLHAHLKNITVEIKTNNGKHGFNPKIFEKRDADEVFVRTHEKEIEEIKV